MIINPQVPLQRLVLSLSEALDKVHPNIVDHQQRVTYIAICLARRMAFERDALVDIFQAAALHDIGLIGLENRVKVLDLNQLEAAARHGEIGYHLLVDNPFFKRAAEIVRHHHARWDERGAAEQTGAPVTIASYILALSDEVERMIDRSANVILQAGLILSRVAAETGKQFHPECVDAFRDAARPEAFWLDAVSPRIYSVLLGQIDWPSLTLDEVAVEPIAEAFGRIVDAASRWTMLHSAGVAATAVTLARSLDFSPREQHLMRAAGFLHDLGKLTVPNRILDKPEKLTAEEIAVVKGHTYHTFRILDTIGGMPQISEWAAFHHERLDSKGYPFRHNGKDLTLGSRIMAVADVFTAVTEDRPYRRGVSSAEALRLLEELVSKGALDGVVVEALRRDYDALDASRTSAQADYGRKQARIAELLHPSPSAAAPPCPA